MKKTKEKFIVIILFLIIFSGFNLGYAEIMEENSEITNALDFDAYVNKIDEYAKDSGLEEIDIDEIVNQLVKNKKFDHSSILKSILTVVGKEILVALRSTIIIYIIVIFMAIISSFDIDEKGDISKIARLVCFFAISIFTVKTFLEVISEFRSVINTMTTIMQVVSPFLLTVLMASGALSTTGIIQPLLLFLAGFVGFLVNYIVIPFFMISVAFNVIYSVSENLRISKVSKMFSSISLWLVGILFTLFLGVLSLESQVSSSVDMLSVKTTQAAVSNFVPVVGKFFSDSFETVVGATKIIGKTGGAVGILSIVIVSAVPIIKLGSVLLIYNILSTLIEPIVDDEKIIKYIDNFKSIYKNLFGILIGIIILFIISTGIVLNLISSIVT